MQKVASSVYYMNPTFFKERHKGANRTVLNNLEQGPEGVNISNSYIGAV